MKRRIVCGTTCRILILLAVSVLGVATPAIAKATRLIALHGAAKVVLIGDASIDNSSLAPVGSPGNDHGQIPNRWAVYHCDSAWELTGRDSRWGVWTWTGGARSDRSRCERFAFNGLTIVYQNQGGYWENDAGGDETAQHTCGEITGWRDAGRPRPSAEIVRGLLRPLGGCL